jgi:RNA polymerase sigma-70 factor (ECF subfamily)
MSDIQKTIKSVMKGKIDAYSRIVREYQKAVWDIVASMLYDRESTEDMVQKTFIQAYIHLGQFDLKRDFGRWIQGIARNTVLQEIRSSKRTRTKLSAYHEYLKLRLENEHAYTSSREKLAHALRVCREQLSPLSKQILDLRYTYTVSYENIADKTGRTLDATRQLLWRIKIKLKKCIERRLADHGTD